ncbi:TonB-dependent receptor [uncultured Dokdonia sp.]|uniref:SusC/RagA family TonB-linked outer membrane protein n=1 Tax=uncultured Dokdonia sp. TaxID=575653 RepID=UPI0026334D82|nr:TonB-dependent receptor [uncultured Dokdonia sp.]
MSKTFIFILYFLSISSLLQAQELLLSGKVLGETSTPILGATILVKNTSRGVTSDFDGNFSLKVSKGETLVVSSVGFEAQEILITNQSSIEVILIEDILSLKEVVIIGYGTSTKKSLTSSVSVVEGEDIVDDKPFTNIENSLQGKISGIQVINPSGSPGQSTAIRIRGAISLLGNSDPLYIIDGIQAQNTEGLNPRDVESISVLKDASATSIYGAQAANGVVLITTKRGEKGKSMLRFSSFLGVNEVVNTLDLLNSEQFINVLNTSRANVGLPLVADPNNFAFNSDFQRELYDPATVQNYEVSFSGGDNNGNYYISGGLQDEQGTIETTGFQRYSLRFNQDREVFKNLKVKSSVGLSRTNFNVINDNQRVNQGGVVLSALQTPPIIGIIDDNGNFPSNPFQPGFDNPIALVRGEDREFVTSKVLANLNLGYTLPAGILINSAFSIDYSQSKFNRFVDPFTTSNGRATNGQAETATFQNTIWLWENTVNYNFSPVKDKINLDFLLGTSIQERRDDNTRILGNNFLNGSITTVNPATEILATEESIFENSNNSIFFRTKISYLDRYFIESTIRRDGSSRFGPSNRFAVFPSFSGSWIASDEKFLQEVSWLSRLKFRIGYGFTGNQNFGNNRFQALFSPNSNYVVNGQVVTGVFPSQVANANLKWESTEQTNFGIDLSLFKNRFNITFETYLKNTTDLLINNPLPITTGFDNATQNIGSIENRGIELALDAVLLDTDDLSINLNANYTRNVNEVTNIGGQIITSGSVSDQGEVTRIEEEQPVGNFFGFVSEGVDPETGNIIFSDLNGDGIIDDNNDRTIIGNALPDFSWATTTTINYKGFELIVFFQGVEGQDIYNATRLELENQSGFTNQSTTVLNAWTPDNPNTDIPRAAFGDPDGNNRASTRWVEDGSFIKLRELTLGYNFPKKWTQKLGINNLKLFMQGRNLATWTNYSGYDPEVSRDGSNVLSSGIDFGTYPQVRTFIGGLNMTF